MFGRTSYFTTPHTAESLKRRLLGDHVLIHNVDFEIVEEDDKTVSIIAHDEQAEEVKTLPDTLITFMENGSTTRVKVVSKVRDFDKGAPMLVMIFNLLIYIAGSVLFITKFMLASYIVLGIGGLVTLLFVIRMQTGYFDYVKKVRQYVREKSA